MWTPMVSSDRSVHTPWHDGKQPSGGVFVYPFGRRYPPLKRSVKNGDLMIAGCWNGNYAVSGRSGTSEIGSVLGQDETGPAEAVPVRGLDSDELWEVADRVSRAVN